MGDQHRLAHIAVYEAFVEGSLLLFSRSRFLGMALATTLVAVFFSLSQSETLPSATAATSDRCGDGTVENGVSAVPSHGQVFYIDTGQNQRVNAAYVGYRISSTSEKKNLWATLSSFEGGVVRLANPADERYRVGDVAANGTEAAFFLLEANQPTITDQSHVLTVFEADPAAGGSPLFSCTFNFVEVKETIKASANKVTSVNAVTVDELGGTVTVTVSGQTGTIGSGTSSPDGEVMWFSPAARSSWPSSSLVLESTSIRTATNSSFNSNDRTTTDTLIFSDPTTNLVSSGNSKRLYYQATYVFRVKGPVPSGTAILPIAQISSGTQIKHTDVSTIPSPTSGAFSVAAPVGVEVTKSALESKVDSDGDSRSEFQYTVTLENTSGTNSASVDQVVDDFDSGLSYFGNTVPTFDGSSLSSAPTLDADGNLVFQGPFTLAPGESKSLVYTLEETTACTVDFSYSNYAWGLVGSQKIGSSSSALQGINLAASSCDGEMTASETTEVLEPRGITQAATDITSTTATLNGVVNPTGTSRPVYFEWGQFPDLSGSTLVPLSDSSSGVSFESVTTALTGLSAGVTYYFRVQIGSVYGETLSFVTTPQVADPTASTAPVTNIVTTSRSESVTFVGIFDANLTTSTPYFRWGEVAGSDCSVEPTSITKLVIQEEINDQGQLANVSLTTAFATTLTHDVTSGLTVGDNYCVQAGIEWADDPDSPDEGDWVFFQFSAAQTISYNGNGNDGGSVPSSSVQDLGTSHTVSTNTLTRSGWTFSGWNTASDGSGTSYSASDTFTVNSSLTLYALWTASVTYNAGTGGSNAPIDTVSYTEADIVTVKPSTGVTNSDATKSFSQWQDSSGNNFLPGQQFTIPASGNVTLTAQWVATYTVTYNANGGVGAPASTSHNSGGTVQVSTTEPTRSGYQFVEWTTDENGGGSNYSPAGTFSISNNTTLWAQWAQIYTVTYQNTAGSGTPPSAQTFVSGSYPTLSNPTGMTKSGFTFGGWKPSGGGSALSAGANYTTDADITLEAFWYASVIYDKNGATGGSVPSDSNQYEDNDAVTVRENSGSLVRTGYTFAGWQTSPGGGTSYNDSGSDTFNITGDTTLFARWIINTYTVTYQNSTGTGSPPSSQTFNHGGSVSLASKPSGMDRSGFTFGGWSPTGGGSPLAAGSAYATNSDVTLEAYWFASVTYDGNGATGGSVPTDSNKYDNNGSVTVLSNTGSLVRTGYTFAGWQSTDVGGTTYGASFTITGNTTLYAKWTVVSYEVTFSGNTEDSGSAPSKQTVSGGASITVPENTGTLVKNGKIFGGWNTEANGSGTTYSPGDTFVPSETMTLHALWLTPYTVTYNGNGNTSGSVPTSSTWGDGQTATAASNTGFLLRSGFTFAGWQTTTTGGTTYAAGTGTFIVTGNITLYAKWAVASRGNSGGNSEGSPRARLTNPPNPVLAPPPAPPPSRFAPPGEQTTEPTRLTDNAPTRETVEPDSAPGPTNRPSLSRPGNLLDQLTQGTLDIGQGIIEVSENAGPSADQVRSADFRQTARRTTRELIADNIGGFIPGESAFVEIIGARTGARFVVTEAEVVDTVTLVPAMRASIDTQRSNFFSVDSVDVATAPIVPEVWNEEGRNEANRLFEASGLPEPASLADLTTDSFTQWVVVQTRANTYVPGSTVYLTLTSQPVVLAQAVVDRNGEVVVTGTVPAEFLTAGEHRIRLVGIRALEGAIVGDDGEIQVTPSLLEEIERFDLGTESTIAFFGSNPEGGVHAAVRVIPLIPVAPWWTLWIIAGAFVATSILRRWGPVRRRSTHIAASAIVLISATPAVVLGWLSTVTSVAWWGLGLGLIATGLYLFIRPRKRDS